MSKIRVAVFGAGGRMGATVCRAVAADGDLVLAQAFDPKLAGIDLAQAVGVSGTGLQIHASPESLEPGSVDVAVDFTRADAAFENLLICARLGIHAVVGTTGLNDEQIGQVGQAFVGSTANCLIAANFAIGAVLMMKFAEAASPFFDTAEVIELHHEHKVDAPSGTALATAKRMAAARHGASFLPDPTTSELAGARGFGMAGGVRVHSVRMRGMTAHQEVILGAMGQTLTIRHDSFDRESFMPGVLLAVKAIKELPGLTIGLDSVIDAKMRS